MNQSKNQRPSTPVLDREYLDIRSKILQLAAALDRIQRHDQTANTDARMDLIEKGIQILLDRGENRAERVQLVFSRPYDEKWQTTFEMRKASTEKLGR